MKKHQNYTICEWFVQMICELSRYFSFAAEEWQSFPHELVTSTQVHGYDHPAVRLGMVYGNMIPIILFYYLDDNANSFSNIFPSKITKTSVPSFPKQFHCFDAFFFSRRSFSSYPTATPHGSWSREGPDAFRVEGMAASWTQSVRWDASFRCWLPSLKIRSQPANDGWKTSCY